MLPGLSPVGGKAIEARFDAACMSSDGGLLALREVEQRLAIASRLAACIYDPRDPSRVVHGLDEIIRTRLLMIAAGCAHGKHLGRPATPKQIVSEIEALALSTNLSIRQMQARIAGQASRGIVGKITKRARATHQSAL
jgi:hypothetical protein